MYDPFNLDGEFDYRSDDWKEERKEVLEDWDGCCERCGIETDSPHVHHKYGTHHRVYEVLCPDCHAEHHGNPEIAKYRKRYPPTMPLTPGEIKEISKRSNELEKMLGTPNKPTKFDF